jgi:hypothetical protein
MVKNLFVNLFRHGGKHVVEDQHKMLHFSYEVIRCPEKIVQIHFTNCYRRNNPKMIKEVISCGHRSIYKS